MKSHRLPFENRWTGGEHAWQWYCELERIGVPNVRAMYVDHELHHTDDNSVVYDVPTGFVRRLSPLSHLSSRCYGRNSSCGPVYLSL